MKQIPPFRGMKKLTRENRIRIGFPSSYETWRNAPARLSDHNLVIHDHPVMEDWETQYMKRLAAAACSRGGRVLEVGFGMGIASRHIQSHKVSSHWVIEANRDVFMKLLAFGEKAAKPVVPIFGFWQDVISTLPAHHFSGILFDTYPLCKNEIHQNHYEFFPEAFRLLEPNGIFTYYSDEIEDFSPEHRMKLEEAGFREIRKEICRVKPPKKCLYWQAPTIVVPIITK